MSGYRPIESRGKPITIKDEGITISSDVDSLDFTGSGVTATGDPDVDVAIPGGGGGGALNDLSDVTITTPSNGEVLKYNGSAWVNDTVAGTGDVVGPASSTDNAVARFDSTTGKLIQNSGVTIDDSNVVSGVTQLNVDNIRVDGNTISSTDANGNINITPNGTGDVVIDGLAHPQADGTNLQVLKTDGAGNIDFEDAGNLPLSRISGSTYSTLQDLQNLFHSAGFASGGTINDNGGATITVDAGTGFIRTSNSETAELQFFDWGALSSTAIPTGAVRYVGVEYNAGSPQVVVRTTFDWNFKTDFPLGNVVNTSGTLHIENSPLKVVDHAANMSLRARETMPYAWDAKNGGLTLGETGTRNVTMSAGTIWEGLNRFSISAKDTSVADSFSTWYYNGSAWVETTGVTQWPNTQYNNIATGLASLTTNWYTNLWFYIEMDNGLHMVYGQNQFVSAAQAEAQGAPSFIPDKISVHSRIIGRFIIRNGGATATEILSAFTTNFGGTLATDHGNLAGLADDDHTQYIRVDGTRAFTGNQSFGDNNITNVGDIGVDSLTADSVSGGVTIKNNNGVNVAAFGVGSASSLVSTLGGALTISGQLGGVTAIDATTESTIESAIDTLANLTSATSLASVGTITTGTWQGTDVGVAHGGTGASTASGARTNLGLFQTKAITVEDPVGTEDITMFYTDVAITVTQMNAVLLGSSTPSVTWTIRHNSDRSATGAEVVTSGTTTTSTTTGSEVTSFNDATIPADSWVWLETTAQSGTVTELNVTLKYTQD